MATPPRPRVLLFNLNIDPPPEPANGDGQVDGQGLTTVTVFNCDPNETYAAWIVDDPTGAGGHITGSGPLQKVGTGSTTFTSRIAAGSFAVTAPGTPNRFVWVQESGSGSQGHPFRAVAASGSGIQFPARVARGATAQATRPVPSAVQLRPEPAPNEPADEGRPRIRQTTLVYSGMIGDGGAWLSAPVHVAPGQEPAFWQLRRCAAHRWELLLRQRDVALAAYGHTTAQEHDFTFPIALALETDSTNACPPSVIVAIAP